MQRDTLPPYLFILHLDNVIGASINQIKEKGFSLKKKRDDIPQKLWQIQNMEII